MKKKILMIILVLTFFLFGSGITYSIFHSSTTLASDDQDIAKFIFNTESLDQIQLPIVDFNPGDEKEYPFSVSNASSGVISNVAVEYQMTVKTYHLVPLVIELYRLNGEVEELILTCDETYTRSATNELICNTPSQAMGHTAETQDNYKLKVKFASEYNDAQYSNLVDYINIEIKSWQKVED